MIEDLLRKIWEREKPALYSEMPAWVIRNQYIRCWEYVWMTENKKNGLGEMSRSGGVKHGGFKIKLTPLRLWQIIAAAACVLAIVFCSLWIQAKNAVPEELLIPESTEGVQPITVEDPPEEEPEADAATEDNEADMDVSDVKLTGKKIVLDPGHGGNVPGGTVSVSGKKEKDLNLEIAKRIKAKFEEAGATVVMTREDDTSLSDNWQEDLDMRGQVAVDSEADMFISIHQNEFTDNPEATGPQVFFVKQGSIGKKLAVCVQDMMNYRLKPETERIPLEKDLVVLRPGKQPSCLVECGFLSNAEEDKLLQTEEYQDKLAQSIVDGAKLYAKKYG